jgi:4-oxalocrotonate tautomerase
LPFVNLRINEELLTPEKEKELLASLTEAVVSVYGDDLRRHTWAVVEPVSPNRWSVAGRSLTSWEEGS